MKNDLVVRIRTIDVSDVSIPAAALTVIEWFLMFILQMTNSEP